MYIVTFYSFKGGTGRSMALMNVAAELLSRGKRVLLVDFDLEAPGLDTFPMQIGRPINGGLVEMISDYLSSDEDFVPRIEEYVYDAKLEGVNAGVLWIMPAGRQDSSYDSRFRSIDWQFLYDEKDGFLLFEDLKLQWASSFSPDYILIDSRTGHTDIGGICTRQLPNAVVAVFVPNEQNIRGLAPVVSDVRKERTGPLAKTIDLHFVMGNVPDLDDEEAILSDAIARSELVLEYNKLAATIHHFSSMSMLKQRLLSVDRPRSKIATEYKQLTMAIVSRNLEDRDGALAILENAFLSIRMDPDALSERSLEDDLQTILALHPRDLEILRRLARLRRIQRRMEEALYLFDQILTSDENDSESLVGRAEILIAASKPEAGLVDLLRFFTLPKVSSSSFAIATRLLLKSDRTYLPVVIESLTLASLSLVHALELHKELLRSYETCEYATALLRKWLEQNPNDDYREPVVYELVLSLIAGKRFAEAKQQIESEPQVFMGAGGQFNYAMAEWGAKGEVPRELFKHFAEQMTDSAEEETDANHLQCFSLAYWASGNQDRALEFLAQSLKRSGEAPKTVFSCWSYLYRSPRNFRADLEAMKNMYIAGFGRPSYIQESSLFPDAT